MTSWQPSLLMAAPDKAEMALQLAGGNAPGHRRWMQKWVLLLGFAVVALLVPAGVAGIARFPTR